MALVDFLCSTQNRTNEMNQCPKYAIQHVGGMVPEMESRNLDISLSQ